MSPQERAALRASVSKVTGYGTVDAQRVELTPARTPQAARSDFFGNIGRSIGSIGGDVFNGIKQSISESPIGKAPQIARSIGDTGFSMGPINIKGKNSVISAQLAKRSGEALKKLQSGMINKKQFDDEMKSINDGFSDLSKKSDKSADALKDASRYGQQFVNTVGILSVIGTGLEQVAGKTVANLAGKQATANAFSGGLKGLGKGIASEIGLPGFVERQAVNAGGNIVTGAAKFLGRAGMNVLDTTSLAGTDMSKIGNIGMTATSLIPGGPLGAGTKLLSAVGSKTTKALYNDAGSVINQLKFKGDETVDKFLSGLTGKEKSHYERLAKVANEHYVAEKTSAKALKQYHDSRLSPLKGMSAREYLDTQEDLVGGTRAVQKYFADHPNLVPKGVSPDRIGVGSFEASEQSSLIKRLMAVPENERMAIIKADRAAEKAYTLNPLVFKKVQNAVEAGDDKLLKSTIREITGTTSLTRGPKGRDPIIDAAVREQLNLPKGYLPIVKPAGAAGFVDSAKAGEIVSGSKAKLGVVGEGLRKVGLSTEQASPSLNKDIFKEVKSKFIEKVSKADFSGTKLDGDSTFANLTDIAESKFGISDLRQLSTKTIASELEIPRADASKLKKLLGDSFLSVPLSERGLGGKAQDINLRYNPIAGQYSRAQGVGRYEGNPFFRLQENTETRIGVGALTGARAKAGEDYLDTIKTLNKTGVFSSGYAGEGAGEAVGRISAKLSTYQKRTMAAGFETMAQRAGQQVEEFVTDPKNADLVDDLKKVAQYPDRGLTSSNFMKALNLVAFPARYNIKVTQLAVKALAQRPGVEQLAVINGIGKFQDFLESDKGTKWQADNAELLGLMQYFTPIGSVDYVMRTLRGKNKNPGDFGSLGGLPFGVVSQILQGQGVYTDSSPYLNPKTGEIVPEKLPANTAARIERAISDVVGTMFTFPGRKINAPSKSEMVGKLTDTLSLGSLSGAKYESKVRGELTPDQKRIQGVLRAPVQSSSSVKSSNPSVIKQIAPSSKMTIPRKELKLGTGRKTKPKFLARPF